MQSILDALAASGFAVAPILMLGDERESGRTMMVTAPVAGEPLPRLLRRASGAPPARRREVLRALGAEVARLHRAGFVHGDLTPYNIFVANGPPMRFSLIDHERTALPRLDWKRRRLRNLVQLCRFDLEGMGRTDRLRVVDAYGRAMGDAPRRLMRRVTRMMRARRRRDTVSGGI
jgi:lipopolysaccharide kinase (Kdo/WaaP) family protein